MTVFCIEIILMGNAGVSPFSHTVSIVCLTMCLSNVNKTTYLVEMIQAVD